MFAVDDRLYSADPLNVSAMGSTQVRLTCCIMIQHGSMIIYEKDICRRLTSRTPTRRMYADYRRKIITTENTEADSVFVKFCHVCHAAPLLGNMVHLSTAAVYAKRSPPPSRYLRYLNNSTGSSSSHSFSEAQVYDCGTDNNSVWQPPPYDVIVRASPLHALAPRRQFDWRPKQPVLAAAAAVAGQNSNRKKYYRRRAATGVRRDRSRQAVRSVGRSVADGGWSARIGSVCSL